MVGRLALGDGEAGGTDMSASSDAVIQPIGMRRAAILIGCIVLCWIPVLVGAGAIADATALYALADGANPYFVPAHGLLLYVWSPLVVASACVLLLSPGLFLSIALNAARSVALWIVTAMASSLVLVSVAAQAVQGAMGRPLLGSAFALVVVACSLACAALMLVRARKPLA